MKNSVKLNKVSRLAFIASLYGSGAMVVNASASEVSEEISLSVAREDVKAPEVDSDLPELDSNLPFASVEDFRTGGRKSPDSAILTASEREQLKREVDAYRAKLHSPFALVPLGFWGKQG